MKYIIDIEIFSYNYYYCVLMCIGHLQLSNSLRLQGKINSNLGIKNILYAHSSSTAASNGLTTTIQGGAQAARCQPTETSR